MTSTECDGVLFFEDYPPEADKGAAISTTIGGVFTSSQLASLRDVKVRLAAECKRHGGNAVVGFTYGQKSSGFLASIFSRDDVQWYGNGFVAKLRAM